MNGLAKRPQNMGFEMIVLLSGPRKLGNYRR
jgi:hypothetical protein